MEEHRGREANWQRRIQEIFDKLKKEEKGQKERIENSKRLSRSWELMKICREIIKENMNVWIERKEEAKKESDKIEKQEMIGRARSKKRDYYEKENLKDRERKITDMLKRIPIVGAERIEKEAKKTENLELSTIGKNLWKKWRVKTKIYIFYNF